MPLPFWHKVEVGSRKNLLFQLVKHLIRDSLIAQHTFCCNSIVFEFNQHELFVTNEHGARAISFIMALSLFCTHFF
jgi:hypothetical protein